MKFSEETLMAYADGELDSETRIAVEAAMTVDSEIARRVAQHLSLAGKVRAAFDPVLLEGVPDRLKDATAQAADVPAPVAVGTGTVIDLSKARAAKPLRPARTWSWPQWSAIAASLVVGLMAGRTLPPDRSSPQMAMDGGGLVARGALEQALSTQLASTQAVDAPVRIGISFLAKSGDYCRTFSLPNQVAGLGCKAGQDWRLQVIARSAASAQSSGAYHMATGETPAAVTREVEERIVGTSLDAREEDSALRSGWHR